MTLGKLLKLLVSTLLSLSARFCKPDLLRFASGLPPDWLCQGSSRGGGWGALVQAQQGPGADLPFAWVMAESKFLSPIFHIHHLLLENLPEVLSVSGHPSSSQSRPSFQPVGKEGLASLQSVSPSPLIPARPSHCLVS